MDLSNDMNLVARRCFLKVIRTIDRFHMQKLTCDALQEICITHRWDVFKADNESRGEIRKLGIEYNLYILAMEIRKTTISRKQRSFIYKSAEKWTLSQKQRYEILFMKIANKFYPSFLIG